MRVLNALLLCFACTIANAQTFTVTSLTVNHLKNPLGIALQSPQLSWKLSGAARNLKQAAYSIRVSTAPSFSNNTIVWQADQVRSDQSVNIVYAGSALRPATRYYWQVQSANDQGKWSAWSSTASFETGLSQQDWKASWIEPVQDTARTMSAIMVRKEFSLPAKKIASARVYVTSHGFYELSLNGKKVGDYVLMPGWTSYQKRLQYQVYDITASVKAGKNAVGAMLGDGWFRGSLGWTANWGIWGKSLGLLCQLKISYADGSDEVIGTDDSWKSSQDGPITVNGIYDGETYDARKEKQGWSEAGFDDSQWTAVRRASHPLDNLVTMETVPVRRISEIHPIKIFRTPDGLLVADLGQNMVGWIRLKVKGNAGTTVTVRHAEVLDKSGNFYTDNLRAARATASYTLKGRAEEVYEPRFSFFGFRYVAIDGFPGDLKPENITGVVVHSDMDTTGSFSCSNPMINQLQHNIQWGQKGNFVDVPTDCPQRDERLGWTGDAQAFCRTAAFNMDVAAFFTKWLKDLSADQNADGKVPFVIPDVLRNNSTSAGWGDVATIAPWTLYQVYGDKKFLEEQYPSMKAYVEYIRSKAGASYLWKGGSVFGDWLFYKSMQQTENDGYTNPDMIATMFYAYSTELLTNAAEVLGRKDDAATYSRLHASIKKAFIDNYVTASGRVSSESQTAYVLALQFGLLPDSMKAIATRLLVEDIKGRRNHLSTGFLGTPYLCHVLSDNGETEVAYDLLLQQTFPSWLYPVKMGATTIWERWDGQKTDSSFQDVGMNSFNHYAYGAVGDWMYRVVAGIEIAAPGYKEILIQPHPTKKLTYATASLESPYGRIVSGWSTESGKLEYQVTIPPNTTATLKLPGLTANGTSEGGKPVTGAAEQGGALILKVGSGSYRFVQN